MITSDRHPNFRHLLVVTNGLVLGVHVHAANRHDRDGAQRLLADRLKEELPRLAIVWADAAYMGRLRNERGWCLEVPRHPDRQLWRYGLEEKPRGFQVLPPRRWVIEKTFAWLGQARRLEGLRKVARDGGGYDLRGDEPAHAAQVVAARVKDPRPLSASYSCLQNSLSGRWRVSWAAVANVLALR